MCINMLRLHREELNSPEMGKMVGKLFSSRDESLKKRYIDMVKEMVCEEKQHLASTS